MAKAYDEAKAGGRHGGFLRNYEDLPDHLIEKAIRSLSARIAEHQRWIEAPLQKVGPGTSETDIRNLATRRWPREVAGFEEQREILQGLLAERRP